MVADHSHGRSATIHVNHQVIHITSASSVHIHAV